MHAPSASAPLALMVCLIIAGCERREATPAPPPVEAAFRHQLSGDVSGDYRALPQADDGWRVVGLFVGQEAAFEAWEAGARDAPPLILSLSGPNGLVQAPPRTYVLSDDRLKMEASARGGVDVALDLQLSQGGLATARRNLGDQNPVMTGTAVIEGRLTPVSLTLWGGD